MVFRPGSIVVLFIVRILETPDRLTRKRLPGDYGDWHEVIEAMEKILAEYPSHGRNAEHGEWWARDSAGQQFLFVIVEN
jgi:hypothetical protein